MDTPPPASSLSPLTAALLSVAGTLTTLLLGLLGIVIGRRARRSSVVLSTAQAKEANKHADQMEAGAVADLIDKLMEMQEYRQRTDVAHQEAVAMLHRQIENSERVVRAKWKHIGNQNIRIALLEDTILSRGIELPMGHYIPKSREEIIADGD